MIKGTLYYTMAERAGFEPAVPCWGYTRFPVVFYIYQRISTCVAKLGAPRVPWIFGASYYISKFRTLSPIL